VTDAALIQPPFPRVKIRRDVIGSLQRKWTRGAGGPHPGAWRFQPPQAVFSQGFAVSPSLRALDFLVHAGWFRGRVFRGLRRACRAARGEPVEPSGSRHLGGRRLPASQGLRCASITFIKQNLAWLFP
jgi:hypothetical protein